MKLKSVYYILLGILIGVLINFSLIWAQSPNENILKNILDILIQKLKTPQPQPQNPFQQQFLNPYIPTTDLESKVINVVNSISPSVVSIIISKYVPIVERYYVSPFEFFDIPPELKPFFQFDFQIPQLRQKGTQKEEVGGGTGFIISSDGLILTNKHVVSDKNAEYTVYLNDGRKFKARVLSLHPVDDLALIKVNATGLPTVKLGNSDNLKLGQFVIAIGNALGEFQNTVSFGVVSGLKRSVVASDQSGNVEKLEGVIQTDAAINFGNSGGPLINLNGEVIGVNTAIVSSAQNIGFAIPINRAKKMIEEFQAKGKIEVPFLGVRYILIDEEVQKKFNLPVLYGAYIYSEEKSGIIPNSPAQRAGLQDRDIILEVDGEKITPQNSLGQIILKKKVGEEIIIKVLRNGNTITLRVVLGLMPENLE